MSTDDERVGQGLTAEIEREEANLARLEADLSRTRSRLSALRREQASLVGSGPPIRVRLPGCLPRSVPVTSEDKVGLFRELFRGRGDLFPTRFESRKTGKQGYAPACANKFVKGLCKLPSVKCGDCRNQAFLPVDDAAVLAHLKGRHVMGVYPLLADGTCWFLAIDFDEGTWAEDVRAFRETCRDVGLPIVVERSRSGNGAHAWFFFSEPVSAAASRRMGCYLITETMSRRHELAMGSYDRLFPSQDTLPKGGFGNLIALPLQWEPRKSGNTVFLDEHLHPYPDDRQWALLAAVSKIDRRTVEAIAGEATRLGRVMGLRPPEPTDEGDVAPWARSPSGKTAVARIAGPLPERVRAVLCQRLFIEKAGLSSPLLDRIKRLAAFQNPEFYEKQRMRLSTALIPRVISCAEDLAGHVALPRGCRSDLEQLLREHDVPLEIEDKRVSGEPVSFRFHGRLTRPQEEAARALLAHDTGVFVAPPGIGKTVMGIYLVAERACGTLVLVHRRPLLDQWRAQLSLFLGTFPREIGQIGGGKRSANGRLDVAMIQSLVRGERVADVVSGYGQVIVDECHHVPAASFERVLAEAKARYVVGLTATLRRRDGHDPIATMQLGPVRSVIDPRSQAAKRPFAQRLVVRETAFEARSQAVRPGIQELYASLAVDERRNDQIFDDVVACLEEGRSPILLTERRDHLEHFAERLRRFARHVVVLHGGMGARSRRAALAQLAAIPADEERLVLATGRDAGEGFDDSRLDTLFLALPISWRGTLEQYAGRLHRLHPGKTEVRIFDYVDRQVPVLLRMFERRLRGYRSIGYARGEAPLGLAEDTEEVSVEADSSRAVSAEGDLSD